MGGEEVDEKKKAIAKKEGAVRWVFVVVCFFAQFVFNLEIFEMFLCSLHGANGKGKAGIKKSSLKGMKKPSIDGKMEASSAVWEPLLIQRSWKRGVGVPHTS